MTKSRCASALAWLLMMLLASPAPAGPPPGWRIAGSAPAQYLFGVDPLTAADGAGKSAYIRARRGDASGYGSLMQIIAADHYRGKRVRLGAMLRTSEADRAQLWMRVDGKPGTHWLSFDNMDARPLSGTREWQRYEIVLDVPDNSIDIAFGFLLSGEGTVWADSFRIESVPESVPVTGGADDIHKEPVNLDFDERN